jgi:DNA polymerase epsilon subunit 2
MQFDALADIMVGFAYLRSCKLLFIPEQTIDQFLEGIVTQLKFRGLSSNIIDLQSVQSILNPTQSSISSASTYSASQSASLSASSSNNSTGTKSGAKNSVLTKLQISTSALDNIQIIDAFSQPCYKYNSVRKVFAQAQQNNLLHAAGDDKANMFAERYKIIEQRILRHEIFCPLPANSAAIANRNHYQITKIDALIGRSGKKYVFGMLTQIEDGVWYLEDADNHIQVDISKSISTSGLFTDHCFVLAEGELVDDVFVITTLAMPPPESRVETLRIFPQLEFCGADLQSRADKESQRLALERELKTERKDDMVIILSDIHLDKPKVLSKLKDLFAGYERARPLLFIFIGDFCSKKVGAGAGFAELAAIKMQFDALADIMVGFAYLRSCKLLFIPGPNDIGFSNAYPQHQLPSIFTQKIRDRFPNAQFGSNPCRVLYYGQEIVVFRANLLQKMRRHCVKDPSVREACDMYEHLVATICDQAHLSPLPLVVKPIYWQYDHTLRLYPLPQLLILADVVDQYDTQYTNCHCVNPGSFSSDFSFIAYTPAECIAQFSRVD